MIEFKINNPILKDCPIIPVVHTDLYNVIECSFAKAKEAGIKYSETFCKDIKDEDLGLITYWEGMELWIPYNITQYNTFTLLTVDKQGNKYKFDDVHLDKNKTKIQNNDFSIKQSLKLHGSIIKPNGDIVDIHQERVRRSDEIIFNLNTQYLQVKIVAGTECDFAKAAKYNVSGAYADIGYEDNTPGDVIFNETGLVWIPKNQSWGTLRKMERINNEVVSCLNVKDFDFKENNGVINVDFHRIDISNFDEGKPMDENMKKLIDDTFNEVLNK